MRREKMGNDSLERVARHLYKRQYSTATGEWSTHYYGKFTDWKRKRRMFPRTSSLGTFATVPVQGGQQQACPLR